MCTEKSSTGSQPSGPSFFTGEATFFSDRLLTDQKQRSRYVKSLPSQENPYGCG
jgi:hypothetical protein